MSNSVYFRLLESDEKPAALLLTVTSIQDAQVCSGVFQVTDVSFVHIPEAPFAYWVGDALLNCFQEFAPFESGGRTAKQGLATADDFRFVRAAWEVDQTAVVSGPRGASRSEFIESTFSGKRWVPFAKGGPYSPYYLDVHLVVQWDRAGQELKDFGPSVIRNEQYYFRPGLTWSLRSQRGFSARAYPGGCIFGHKGPVAFVEGADTTSPTATLGGMNSSTFAALLACQMAFGSYEVGAIQRTPVPFLGEQPTSTLVSLVREAYDLMRDRDLVDETTHTFRAPVRRVREWPALATLLDSRRAECEKANVRLAVIQREIDQQVATRYGLTTDELIAIQDQSQATASNSALDDDQDDEQSPQAKRQGAFTERLLSWCVGAAAGRWDARVALDPTLSAALQGPFDPLPVCSPGMLVGTDGLPAKPRGIVSEEWLRSRPDAISLPPKGSVANPTITDNEYPLRIDWDGILVDDPDHQDDIVNRVREVLTLLWSDRAEAIEQDACDILGVPDLREWFRNPRRFWKFHVKRYSKSRRKAPIYWMLQSPRRNYAIWLYYLRLDADILFKALLNYVEPKLRVEEDRLQTLSAQRQTAAGSEIRRLERVIDQQESLLSDLHDFRDRLDRAARLHLRPDLDDGVLLNIAPLWELVPWKDAKRAWDELLAGRYEWSSISKQLREQGLV